MFVVLKNLDRRKIEQVGSFLWFLEQVSLELNLLKKIILIKSVIQCIYQFWIGQSVIPWEEQNDTLLEMSTFASIGVTLVYDVSSILKLTLLVSQGKL